MRYLPDGEQMACLDANTIQNIGIPSLVLMERAALRIRDVINRVVEKAQHILIVCGSGNNGGDGFALARQLWELGTESKVVFVGNDSSGSEDCRIQMKIIQNLGMHIDTQIPKQEYDVIVDAVFGVGLSRDVTGKYAQIIDQMNQLDGVKVAVDIPSGIHAASGKVLGTAFRADYTVSMQCEKLGTVLSPGRNYAGVVMPVPIGIDERPLGNSKEMCFTLEPKDLDRLLPKRSVDTHKGNCGRILVIAGSEGMSGAAYLCAMAAYRCGAGLVRIYTPDSNREILQTLLPEAMVTTYHTFDREQIRTLMDWADVTAIGPGIGTKDLARKLVEEVIGSDSGICIVDADGLNLLSERMELLKVRKNPVILTPHVKEMARLASCSVKEVLEQRFEVMKKITENEAVICVLKDARTVVKQKEQKWYVNTSGNSSMSKGGSGDVLTGVIAALAGQGCAPWESAYLGVYLHGCGGDHAKEEKGIYSVLARDLIAGIEHSVQEVTEE